jgi:hypothetical protein
MRSYDIKNVNIRFMRHLTFLCARLAGSLYHIIQTASDGRVTDKFRDGCRQFWFTSVSASR